MLHSSTINYLNKSWSCQIFCFHFRYNYYCTYFKFKTIHNILYKCVSSYIAQDFRSDILIFGSNLNKIRNSINRLSNIRFGFTPQKKNDSFFKFHSNKNICFFYFHIFCAQLLKKYRISIFHERIFRNVIKLLV